MEPPALKELIGKEVLALIPVLHATQPTTITIHGLELGGMWIEHDPTTQKIMRDRNVAASEQTVVLFVPYSGIGYLVGTVEKTALSESAFSG